MYCIIQLAQMDQYRIYYSTWIQKLSCGWEMWAFSLAYSTCGVGSVACKKVGPVGMGSHGGNRGIQEKNWDNWGKRVWPIWEKRALGPTTSLILWNPGHATEVELSCILIFHSWQEDNSHLRSTISGALFRPSWIVNPPLQVRYQI